MNAEEARERGLGCARGFLFSMAFLAVIAVLIWVGIRAAR